MPSISAHSLLNAVAVAALGGFLWMLPWHEVPTSNQNLALVVVSGLVGFIGGAASAKLAQREAADKGDSEPP